MFGFGKKKGSSLLEEKMNGIQINLENNYKDEAHKAYKESIILFEEQVASGELSGKQKEKIEAKLKEFAKKLENYGHNLHVGW